MTDLSFLPIEKDEKWKLAEDFPNYYISNYGRIYSLYTKKLLSTIKNTGDYIPIKLSKNKKVYNERVHRITAKTFIPNPMSLPEVNHLNGNKSDNKVTNLEWCTSKENSIHAYNIGLNKRNKKVVQLSLNGDFIAKFISCRQAEKITKISHSDISRACKSGRGYAKGFQWVYLTGYEHEDYKIKEIKNLCPIRSIEMLSIEGYIEKVFSSYDKISKDLGYHRKAIKKACDNKSIYKNKLWRYKDEI